ncbi:MAG: HpcH/HpaI aldolase family protein [Planctomycetaceae bacterium]
MNDAILRPLVTSRFQAEKEIMTESHADLIHTRTLRQRLKDGKPSLGCWLTITDPLAIEAIAADCGPDWVMFDMEHAGTGWENLKAVLLGWKGSKIPFFVRVPSHDPTFMARVLDLGASGVVVPFVNTPEEAARIVSACRYPPVGRRGVAPRRVGRHGTQFEAYLASANDEVFVMVQIEHATAVGNVDAIAQTPGLDAIFIGPCDLSYSLGVPLQWDHPKLNAAIETVIAAGKKCGRTLAMAVDGTPEEVVHRIRQGIQLTTIGIDWYFMRSAINQQTSKIRTLLGEL